ncbi:MAG: hypothetical protein GY719_28350 [bacterium]|nr:hypothetical protein [bacterium]
MSTSPATPVRGTGRHGERGARPPKAKDAGAEVRCYSELTRRQRRLLHRDFQRQILPALTPMALDPGHPLPRVFGQSINLAVILKEPGHRERFGSLTLPNMFPRLWRIPGGPGSGGSRPSQFVRLEEVVAANVDSLFPGLEVVGTSSFRIRCTAGDRADGDSASNRLPPMRARHHRRRCEPCLRLEVARGMPRHVRDLLIQTLGISPEQAVTVDGPL